MSRKKSKKRSRRFYTLLNIAVGAAIAAVIISAVAYSTGFTQGRAAAMTVGGEKVSGTEFNYFFRDTYDDFRAAYADIVGTDSVIDKSTPLNRQNYAEDCTWAQFFLDACKEPACRTETVYRAAVDAGWTLRSADTAGIDAKLATLSARAKENGMSLSAFLKSFYGKSAGEKSYGQYLYRKALAESYSVDHYNSIEITEDEKAEWLAANPDSEQDAETALRDEAWSLWYEELSEKYPAEISENVTDCLYYQP